MNDGILLEQVGAGRFMARGGPCDGASFVIHRSEASEREKERGSYGDLSELKDGLRDAGDGVATIKDYEYEVRTDGHSSPEHSRGNDARLAPETALATLRSVRPELPEPSPRLPIWPPGEWSEDIGNLWILPVGERVSALDIENLRLAM